MDIIFVEEEGNTDVFVEVMDLLFSEADETYQEPKPLIRVDQTSQR